VSPPSAAAPGFRHHDGIRTNKNPLLVGDEHNAVPIQEIRQGQLRDGRSPGLRVIALFGLPSFPVAAGEKHSSLTVAGTATDSTHR